MKLYEIGAEYRAALEDLEEQNLSPQVIEDTLSALSGEFEEKAKAVAAFIRNLEADEAILKEEIKRQQARAKAAANKAQSLRNYLMRWMQETGKRGLDDPVLPIRIVKNPPHLVLEEDAVPDALKEPEVTYKIDKAAIRAMLKEGAELNWAKMESTERIVIG